MIAAEESYETVQHAFRTRRDAILRSENGWLATTGLTVLTEGENALAFGRITLEGDTVRLAVHPHVHVTRLGQPVRELRLRADQDDDIVTMGNVTHQLIRRGDTLAIRSRDPSHPRRLSFLGAEWFPIHPDFRVEARAIPLGTPRTQDLAYSVAAREAWTCEYVLVFRHAGVLYSLEPIVEPRRLLVLFRDATGDGETYPAGRYLHAPLPRHGRAVLDFNQALTPGCAYSDHVMCPLPPERNTLPFRVEAGEKRPRWAPDAPP